MTFGCYCTFCSVIITGLCLIYVFSTVFLLKSDLQHLYYVCMCMPCFLTNERNKKRNTYVSNNDDKLSYKCTGPFILQPLFQKSGSANSDFFLVNHFSRTRKKGGLQYKSTFLEPLFSNRYSRTTFLKPLFSNHLNKWLQIKCPIVYLLIFLFQNSQSELRADCL